MQLHDSGRKGQKLPFVARSLSMYFIPTSLISPCTPHLNFLSKSFPDVEVVEMLMSSTFEVLFQAQDITISNLTQTPIFSGDTFVS